MNKRQGYPHFCNVKGCAGLVRTGGPLTLSASYAVNPRQAITSR